MLNKGRKDMICVSENEDKPHEECGVFGMLSPEGENVAQDIYYGLLALQHRGQEPA